MDHKHKMGNAKILPLVISMSTPAIISMSVQALYNIVDSMFIGQYSTSALTALSLAFPLQIIVIALFVGLGVGVNSLIARSLGAHRDVNAQKYAFHGLILTFVIYFIVAVIGMFGINNFFQFFTNDAQVIQDGLIYTKIIMIFSFGSFFAQTIMSIMQGSGNMVASMWIQLTGAIVNIILDPIFIFGWFGVPKMGVAGAAIATIIGQIASLIVSLGFLFSKKQAFKLHFEHLKVEFVYFKDIFFIGLPVALMQGVGSIMLSLMNLILASFGDVAITVMGIYFKLQSLVFMPVFGLNQGILPILAYNYGARNKERIKETLKVGVYFALGYMTLGMVIFQLFPQAFLSLFNASGEILSVGTYALRIISLGYPLAAIAIILSTIFQATGDAKFSMYQSFLRQIIFLVPFSYLAFKFLGINYGWVGFNLSEIGNFLFVLWTFRYIYNLRIKNL